MVSTITASLLLAASIGQTQEAVARFDQLQLVTHVASERYLLDQPIKLYVGVRNPTKLPYKEAVELYPNTGQFAVELSRDGGDWLPYKFWMMASGNGPGTDFPGIEAGQCVMMQYEMRREDARTEGVLDRPGRWRIRTTFQEPKAAPKLESRQVGFTIEEPKGKDALAHAALKDRYNLLGMYAHDAWGNEVTGPFPGHLAEHPDSGYAPEVALSLANSLCNYALSNGDRKLAEEADKWLVKFESEWAGSQQVPQAMFLRAKIAHERGSSGNQREAARAAAILKQIEEKHPMFAATDPLLKLRKEMEKK